jgi:hypothetical protein
MKLVLWKLDHHALVAIEADTKEVDAENTNKVLQKSLLLKAEFFVCLKLLFLLYFLS